MTLVIGDRVLAEEIVASAINDQNSADITITSAQILALTQSASTSLLIVNPPALTPTVGNASTIVTTANTNPGYVLVPTNVVAYYKSTAVAYVANGSTGLSIVWDGGAEACRLPFAGLLDQTADKMAVAGLVSPAAVGPLALANKGLRILSLVGTPTTGTGTLSLRIFYRLVPANF